MRTAIVRNPCDVVEAFTSIANFQIGRPIIITKQDTENLYFVTNRRQNNDKYLDIFAPCLHLKDTSFDFSKYCPWLKKLEIVELYEGDDESFTKYWERGICTGFFENCSCISEEYYKVYFDVHNCLHNGIPLPNDTLSYLYCNAWETLKLGMGKYYCLQDEMFFKLQEQYGIQIKELTEENYRSYLDSVVEKSIHWEEISKGKYMLKRSDLK